MHRICVRQASWDNTPNVMKAAPVIAVGTVLLAGCAHKRTAHPPPPPPAARAKSSPAKAHARESPPPLNLPYVEDGIASWYGHPYHGRVAANGEVYDME